MGGYANSALISRLRAAASPEGEAFRVGGSPSGEAFRTDRSLLPLGEKVSAAPPADGSFSLRAKSRLRRLRSDTRLRAQPLGGSL